jgi:hypothetical protein
MDDQRKKIEDAIILVARIITECAYGGKYLPIYNRLKAERMALRSHDDHLAEIRQFAEGQRQRSLSRPWPHGPNAAARPVKAVVRASRSILVG